MSFGSQHFHFLLLLKSQIFKKIFSKSDKICFALTSKNGQKSYFQQRKSKIWQTFWVLDLTFFNFFFGGVVGLLFFFGGGVSCTYN